MTKLTREAMIQCLNRINVDTVANLRQWPTRNLERAIAFWDAELTRACSEFGFNLGKAA